MTLQKIVVANLSDIACIRLSCKKCGAYTAYSLNMPFPVPNKCQQCPEQWSEVERAAIYEFVRHLMKVRDNTSNGSSLIPVMEFNGLDKLETS